MFLKYIKNAYYQGNVYLNIDLIVLQELGGYSAENLAKAEQIARENMKVLLRERKDFMIESNLSKSSDYDWISLMRKNGYDTIFLSPTRPAPVYYGSSGLRLSASYK